MSDIESITEKFRSQLGNLAPRVTLSTHPTRRHRMKLHIRFWMRELPIRSRRWWHQHWWPSRIKQLNKERQYWKTAVSDRDDLSGCSHGC